MKILTEYTWNYLKKNRKNTISILIAITIGTILLSTVVLGTYMSWNHYFTKSALTRGNYHGAFEEHIDKSQIPYLKENQKVDKVYLRSEFYSCKIDMERPYINISYLDKEYWKNMPDKNAILEGRYPEKSDEIVVAANLLKENPQYKLGDKINVKLGYRQKDGKKIDSMDFIHEGEIFTEEKEREYTIVGTVRAGQSLSYESYYGGLGFLDRNLIDENTKLFPFLRMKNPRQVYKDLPEIGKTLGFEKGESTNREDWYKTKYNICYLQLQGIFPPSLNFGERISFSTLIYFIFILFVMILFVIIIYSAFTVWSNNRLKQLGILKSIGATPKQIKKTVRLEAIFLSIIPIILGVVLGHLFCYLMLDKINIIINDFIVSTGKEAFQLVFKTSPIIIGIIVILSFVTILLSTNKPAKELSKIVPIEAIKHSGLDYEHIKRKKRKYNDYSPNNIISSLAKDSLNGNRKGFRTTIISITISFVIMFVFLVVMGGNKADKVLNTIEKYYPLRFRVLTDEIADENLFKEIKAIPEIKKSVVYKFVPSYFRVKPEYASEEFKNVGGFQSIEGTGYYYEKYDDGYEIKAEVVGIDHENFNKYVKSQGGNPEEYYDKENPKAILLNIVKEDMKQPINRANFIPYLNDNVNNLNLSEYYGERGYSFDIDIGLKVYQKPIKDYYLHGYTIYLFVPKGVLNSLMENFELPGDYSHTEDMKLLVDEKDFDTVKESIRDISKYYLPESDYSIWSILDDEAEEEMANKIVYLVTFSVVFFLGVIGISNAYSSINNNLRNRRQEFAMLKSVGITEKQLRKMLNLEEIYYSVYPFVFSIPISLMFLVLVVKVNKFFSFEDLLMFIDYRIIIGYIVVVFVSIYLAYYFGIRKVENDKIINVLKDESI